MTNSKASGRCLCGQVSYEYSGSVGPASYCHCEDCRRCTGSAFNVGVRMDVSGFRLTSGRTRSFTKRADSGNELTRHFCPQCGSPIYTSAPSHPDYVYVKAGTLDDTSLVHPSQQNWISSRVAWAQIAEGLRSYAKGRE